MPVYELIGRAGEVEDRALAYARIFAGAVALFQERRFTEARKTFESCAKDRPGDLAVDLYFAEVARHLEAPPGADWNRAIQLTTK